MRPLLCLLVFASAYAQPPAQKLCQISGVVRRADTQEALAKASVVLNAQDESASPGPRIVLTGPDGSFAFSGISTGEYTVQASRNGFVTGRGGASRVSLRPGEIRSDIELTLAEAGTISGTVVDRDGEPVEGLPVMPLRVRYETGGRRELFGGGAVTTDDHGRFRLYGLDPGLYYLRTGGPIQTPMGSMPLKESPTGVLHYSETWYPDNALADDSEPLHVVGGDDVNEIRISVAPEAVFSIEGRIEGSSKGVSNAMVVCTKALPVILMFGSGGTSVQPDGSFRINGLGAGEYILTAEAVDREGFARVRVMDQNLHVNIDLGNAAEVRGRVALAEQNESLPRGLKIVLTSKSSIQSYLSELNDRGQFDIKNVPPGEYTWFFVPPQGQGLRFYIQEARCGDADYTLLPLSLDPRSLLSDCEITLSDTTGIVRGQVVSGDTPLVDRRVVIIPQSRDLRMITRRNTRAKSGPHGEFEIKGIPPGDYYLFAMSGSADDAEYALGFADLHRQEAIAVEVKANETQTIKVTPIRAAK